MKSSRLSYFVAAAIAVSLMAPRLAVAQFAGTGHGGNGGRASLTPNSTYMIDDGTAEDCDRSDGRRHLHCGQPVSDNCGE